MLRRGGWNPQSGSNAAWEDFKERVEGNELADAVDKLHKAGVINSPDYWKKGKGYSDENVVSLIIKTAAHI